MTAALTLLMCQGVLGAADTLYYHEYRARLPAGGATTRPELLLHGVRDLVYAFLFGALPFIAFHGVLAVALGLLVAAEMVITLVDFVVADRVRKPLGGVFPGERAMHAVMAIVYGAMLAHLVPELLAWAALPTGLVANTPLSPALTWVMVAMSAGVLVSGVRDLAAANGVRGAAFPWDRAGHGW